jgi:hypothetical protein
MLISDLPIASVRGEKSQKKWIFIGTRGGPERQVDFPAI